MGAGFSWILAILSLGVLIVVHEAGHYLVARWSKMRVEKFSVGFGPAILKWKSGDTQFQLAPIPLGGFVQITGMNPHEEFDAEDPNVYPNRPLYQRFLTIFAGPATNVLFSSVLIFIVLLVAGGEKLSGRTVVSDVRADGAANGFLVRGDVIVSIDGQPFVHSQSGLRDRVQASGGKPMRFVVLRGGQETAIDVTPRKLDDGTFLLGVAFGAEVSREPLPVGRAAWASVRYPVIKSQQILAGLWDIVTRKAPPDAVGPVGMTRFISNEFRAGWIPALELLAILNVYLGLFNLLPLPALDGGRLVFLVYEMATRRRPNPKVEAAVHMAGFLILFVVMILVTFKDIKGLFT